MDMLPITTRQHRGRSIDQFEMMTPSEKCVCGYFLGVK